jgi:hypothetical protein
MTVTASDTVSIYYTKSGFITPDDTNATPAGFSAMKFLRNNTATSGSVLVGYADNSDSTNFVFALAAGESIQLFVPKERFPLFRVFANGNDWTGASRPTTAALLVADALQWLGE